MKKITEKAGLVGQRVVRRGVLAKTDPMLIVAVISVIVGMARLYLDCRKHWASPKAAAARGRGVYTQSAERLAMQSLFQQNLPESAATAVSEEFFAEFDRMSDEEIQKVIQEVEG